MNKVEVGDLIDELAAYYPGQSSSFTEKSMEVWTEALRDIPAEAVTAVLPGVMDESPRFLPPLGMILKAIKDAINPQISESAAWTLVLRAVEESMNNIGYPGETKFRRLIGEWLPGEQGDAVANAACRLGLAPILNNYERMMTPFFKALKDTQTELRQQKDRVAIGANGAKEIGA